MVDQHQEQLEIESRERSKRFKVDQELRRSLEFEHNKAKEELEKKMHENQEALQGELLARDRAREAEVGFSNTLVLWY
jgi:hypothetical protein